MKLAIVADWLTNYGGAENVVSAFHELYPDAPIYTTLFRRDKMRDLATADVRTSYLQKIPFARHQLLLPWMPMAIESFDLDEYDVVLSSCHSVAKGVITLPSTLHICYCHTPMRYAWESWDLETRLQQFPRILHPLIRRQMESIRRWDRIAAERADSYIANSSHVKKRIRQFYNRDSTVLYPPVRGDYFQPVARPANNYFLAVGRLIPYKRFDLLIETFNQLKLPLKIVGIGPDMSRLKSLAGSTVQLMGYVDSESLRELYANCTAFLFPQLEDAGITILEAMCCGRPVIAYDEGGSQDTMIDGKTGLVFPRQTPGVLMAAIREFHQTEFDPRFIRSHALKFDVERFKEKVATAVESQWREFQSTEPLTK
ncbi:glycosyltransferase [Candidatus Peregrinibacteria bacterium]|nr:glycosyltransferase [Candidatus Peregrinibacteria bacterium]